MNEPFYPHPIPRPPEIVLGAMILVGIARLVARLRRILRSPGGAGTRRESRLSVRPIGCRGRNRRQFPVLPPPEF